MIVQGLFSLFGSVLHWFLGLLPGFGLPGTSTVNDVVADSRVWQYWGWANHFLPLTLIMSLLAARLALWAALHALDALDWVLTKVHIFGGSS